MRSDPSPAPFDSRPWTRHTVPWAGAVLILAIVAMAAYDTVRSYRETVHSTTRELEAQARSLAEQTARSLQAVDIALRHFSNQFRSGAIAASQPDEIRAYLLEQSVGLVQIDGIAVFDARGNAVTGTLFQAQRTPLNVAGNPQFESVRNDRNDILLVSSAIQAEFDRKWVFPLGRRLESATGEFAGVIAARGRIEYFEGFYRDVRPDPGTAITLMHDDGTLVVRHPAVPSAVGRHFPLFDEVLTAYDAARPFPGRAVSPVDGVDRFAAVQRVPEYPLTVIVTRDAAVALAPWRSQALGTLVRTLALSALGALLLVLLMRQLGRLYKARESLEASQERFALAVSGSNDGIIDWDVVNDRMYSSQRAMDILGIDSEVTVRPRAEWSALVKYHPDDLDRMRRDLERFLDGETDLRDGEYRIALPNGDYRWIRHRNRCVRDEHGRPTRVAGSVSDIDAQKRAEADRLELEGQLLQAKKLEAIGTLAGGIAHDFNNILAAILGNAELAQQDAAEKTALRRHIDAVVSAGLRAKSLVARILAFSRSGMGERVPVHVESVIGEVLDLVAAALPSHVQLERHLTAGDARVMADPTQIHQVAMNLCTNAVQAMKSPGTLTVSLDQVDKAETLAATSTLPGGSYVRLRISDTGSGIAPAVIDRIFDPFFTTKEVGVGTGLGLSLVHGIVTDLGGGVDVESRVGEGTTFTVYLPWSGAMAIAEAADEIVAAGGGETILLVDDEEALVSMGEEMLARLGYEPIGFKSSTAALDAFRKDPERFSAVLTDEAMPEMTGSELARELLAIRPRTPVVLMTGFVTTALVNRARANGIAEVLAKPLAVRDVARSLALALRYDTTLSRRSL